MKRKYLFKSCCIGTLFLVISVLTLGKALAQSEDINIREGVTNYLSASTYNFLSSSVGVPIGPIVFTIENLGAPSSLTLTGGVGNYVVISGPNAADFVINQIGTTSPIPSLGNTTFMITFTPSAIGARTANIIIGNSDNIGGENPYIINLSGVGIAGPTISTNTIVPSTLCQGSPINVPFNATGTFIAGNVFTAELSDAAGSFASPIPIGILSSTVPGPIAATIPLAQPIGNLYRIRVVSSNPVVVGTVNNVDLTIIPALTADAGLDISTCPNTPVFFNPVVTGSPTIFNWSFGDANTSVILNTNHSYVLPGNFNVTLTVSKPGCLDAVDNRLVTVNPLPANPAVSTPVTYCQGFAASPLTAAGVGFLWYNVPTGGIGSGISPVPNTIGIGTTSYYVSQTILGCESPRAQIDVVVGPTLTASILSAPASVCAGNTISLSGSATGSPSTIFWTGGGGSYAPGSNAPSPTFTPNAGDIAAGIVNFSFSALKSGCLTSTVNVSVNITALPLAPNVSSPVNYCVGFSATPLSAIGSNLLWYNVPVGGIGSGVAPTPSTAVTGNTNYYVSQTVGGCEGSRVLINVVVDGALSANAGPDISGCINTSLSFVGGALGGPTSYLWTFGDAGTSTLLSPNHTYTASGSFLATLTVSKPGCLDATDNKAITVNPSPSMPSTITGSVTTCTNTIGNAYSVINVPPNTYIWSYSGTGATINGTTNAPTIDYSPSATSGILSVAASNVCGTSLPRTLAITMKMIPLQPSVISGATTICENTIGNSFSVINDPNTTLYNWTYQIGTGHTITGGTTNSPLIDFATGATSGTISVTAHTICGASPASLLPITIKPFPAAPSSINGNTNICENSFANPYDVTNVAGMTYNWAYSGSGYTINGGTANAITMDMSFTSTSGTLSVTATNVCGTSASSSKLLTMQNIAAQPSIISGLSTVCENSTNAYNVTIDPLALSYNWSYSGTGHFINPTMNSASVDFFPGATSGVLSVTATNACGVSFPRNFPITISVPNLVVNNPSPVCTPSTVDLTATSITLGSTAGLTYFYFQDPGATIPQPGAAGINTSGIYYIKGVDAFSCYAISPVTVVINAGILNSLSITPARDTICSGENTTVTINATENGVTYKAYKNITTQVGSAILGDGSNIGIPITYAELNNFGNEITIQASLVGCTPVTLLSKDSIFKSDLVAAPIITSTVASLCSPGLAIFSVPNTFAKYKWYYGTSNSFASASQWVNEALNSDTVDLPGFYFVEVGDSYNCKLNSAGKNIDYTIAPPTVSQSGNTGKQVDLTCAVSSPYYQWYVENAGGKLRKIQGANGAVYRAYFDGIYYVAIQNSSCTIFSNGVGVSSMAGGSILKQNFYEYDSTVVIPELEIAELYVFPNPSLGSFEVKYLSSTEESARFILYNSAGRLIVEKQVHQKGFVSVSFEEENLEAGVYYIEVIQYGEVARGKIVVY